MLKGARTDRMCLLVGETAQNEGEERRVFVATFLIGLREGLEATLIVGILAAFLKRSNEPVRPVIMGALAAVVVSIIVGAALMFTSNSLPQAQQEALETVIGIIAVAFVTTMILWMNVNARSMKGELEGEAQQSLSKGGARAMVGMAFLAVVKEGFETAVFLLAVFQSSHEDASLGIMGAVLGIVLAILIGYLIYYGGAHFNLGLFFKITGPFLILIAAGFVANVFRTGHEAGWVNIGQQQIFDFSAVISNNSVVGALLQGMFSIQADPRLIEVIAWFAYLIPVMIIYLWPQSHAFTLEQRIRTKRICAGACVVVAVILFAAVPRGTSDVAGATRTVDNNDVGVSQITYTGNDGDNATFTTNGSSDSTTITLQHVSDGSLDGAPLSAWQSTVEETPSSDLPSKVTLNDLIKLNNGRLPSGLNVERTPGPFKATWTESSTYSAQTSETSLISASRDAKLLATLSGGGISGTRVVNVSGATDESWSVVEEETTAAQSQIRKARLAMDEASLYWLWIPVALVGVAAGVFASSVWDSRKKNQVAVEATSGKTPQTN